MVSGGLSVIPCRSPGIMADILHFYNINPAYWQLSMGFIYQSRTESLPLAEANDRHVSDMLPHDIWLANTMKSMGASARCLPVRTIWAQIHQYDNTVNPLADSAGHNKYIILAMPSVHSCIRFIPADALWV